MRKCATRLVTVLSLALMSVSSGGDFTKGQDAYSSGDYETAKTEWQPLAEEGHSEGQFGMGLLYANGFGVALDDDLALKWYGLAADQGHGQAQCNLAVMHANGWGVPLSDEEAFKWYSLASEQGVTQAQIGLAMIYTSGFGAEKNNVLAHKWLAIATDLGDTGAMFKRDMLAERMSAEEISESGHLTSVWMENHQTLHAND